MVKINEFKSNQNEARPHPALSPTRGCRRGRVGCAGRCCWEGQSDSVKAGQTSRKVQSSRFKVQSGQLVGIVARPHPGLLPWEKEQQGPRGQCRRSWVRRPVRLGQTESNQSVEIMIWITIIIKKMKASGPGKGPGWRGPSAVKEEERQSLINR